MSHSQAQLLEEAHGMCRDPRLRETLLRHCREIEPTAADSLNTRIHPNDQMLTHSLRHHGDVGAALSQYFSIALQQYRAARQVMRSCGYSDGPAETVLDFACGYGRLIRFLSLGKYPSHIWASELQADALEFVSREFSVRTLPSHADPARFECAERFDFIWVASLFSHLPDGLFQAWLARLASLLTPRGVLCFSVRDAALLPGNRAMPDSGFLFDSASENAELDPEIYGTAYASEDYVRAARDQIPGQAGPCVRLPRALAHEQDLYVVASDPGADLAGLAGFRRGPWGWVDRRSLSAAGCLVLEGWAASLDDGLVEAVEIAVDGVAHRSATGLPRTDVSEALGDDRAAHAGWRFQCELGRAMHKVYVEVNARTANGETSLLFCGLVRSTPDAG